MTNPGPTDPPIWALFDASGLQIRFLTTGRTPDEAQEEAFAALDANAGSADVYIVQLRFSDPQNVHSWLEVGDRIYASTDTG